MAYRGPSAPWHEEEDEIFPLVLQRCKDFIVEHYIGRIESIRRGNPSTEAVKTEIQRLIAASAVNDPMLSYYLVGMLEDLLHAEETARTLL